MKNAIRQYRPAFFEGFENETVEFDTLEELLAIPWVHSWSEQKAIPETEEGGFDRYSKSDGHLMAELKGPRAWWVIGFIKHPDLVDLPTLDTSKRD